jgi:hypothetical protein
MSSQAELDSVLPDRFQRQIRLEESGVMFAAGPMTVRPAGGLGPQDWPPQLYAAALGRERRQLRLRVNYLDQTDMIE